MIIDTGRISSYDDLEVLWPIILEHAKTGNRWAEVLPMLIQTGHVFTGFDSSIEGESTPHPLSDVCSKISDFRLLDLATRRLWTEGEYRAIVSMETRFSQEERDAFATLPYSRRVLGIQLLDASIRGGNKEKLLFWRFRAEHFYPALESQKVAHLIERL